MKKDLYKLENKVYGIERKMCCNCIHFDEDGGIKACMKCKWKNKKPMEELKT